MSHANVLCWQGDETLSKECPREARARLHAIHAEHIGHALRGTREWERLTGQESRLTILGHLLRGGIRPLPSQSWLRMLLRREISVTQLLISAGPSG